MQDEDESETTARRFNESVDDDRSDEPFDQFADRILPSALSDQDISTLKRFIERLQEHPPPDFEGKKCMVAQINEILTTHSLRIRTERGLVRLTVNRRGRGGIIQSVIPGVGSGGFASSGISIERVPRTYIGRGLVPDP